MTKWFLFIAVAVLIVMGVLASTLGLNPTLGMHNGFLFSFASGVNSIGRIIAVFMLAFLIVSAIVIAIAALVDIFNKNKE
jgi:hypothetical protein